MVNKLNLDSGSEYTDLLKLWRERKLDTSPFTGNFLLNFVSNSSKLEGIEVTYNDTRELFETGKLINYSGDLRNVFSVLNNKKVAEYLSKAYYSKEKISISLIKETHKYLLFGSLDERRYEDNKERAGEFKKKDYCVGKYSVGVSPIDVPKYLQDLCDTVDCQGQNCDALKLAAVFHCYFENIHAFSDGNGRVGRWLTNYLLCLNRHPPVLFTSETRREYFAALEEFDCKEEYTPMYNYLKSQTIISWPSLRDQL